MGGGSGGASASGVSSAVVAAGLGMVDLAFPQIPQGGFGLHGLHSGSQLHNLNLQQSGINNILHSHL